MLYHNIFDFSLSQHRLTGVSKCSKKRTCTLKVFQVCDSMTQPHFILQKDVNMPKKQFDCSVDSLSEVFKTNDQSSKR